jgi:hypothetical protein
MRKLFFAAVLLAIGAAAMSIESPAQAQPYGPGMMGGYGGGYGPGYMMGPGYGRGYGPGYRMGPGYGYGPGMMDYGYAPDQRGYGPGRRYRGQRLCWKQTDSDHGYGYYAPCGN